VTTEIIKNILSFVLLVLAQVLVIQNVNLTGYVILLPYVLWILMLPFETSRQLVMLSAFAIGVVIDYFYDSSGLHAFSCTMMGFSRYYVLKYIAPRDGYDQGVTPTIYDMGAGWFLRYAGILIFIHHFSLFYLEIFRFPEFLNTFLRVVLSSAGTLGFVYLIQFLFFNGRRRT
jgi:rod shape-determining protein MreD